jgi:hypothetical protein
MLPILSADLSRARRVGGAHEMPPVPAGDSLRSGPLPGVSGEAGVVWSGRGTADVRTQNTARDWYR